MPSHASTREMFLAAITDQDVGVTTRDALTRRVADVAGAWVCAAASVPRNVIGMRRRQPETVEPIATARFAFRSEEHTSELQSHGTISYAVSLDRKSVV